ncbi:MAG: DUF4389 domain-containing protein, partial [Bacteroidia bacterium]|nr:DUF4389 domain-containing protein [Bacteroidia bacterium]
MFLSIVQNILIFISWWAVLFTAKYPRSFFDFQVSIFQWTIRLAARIYNLSDGYPAFGMTVQDKYTELTIPYPETLSRSILLLRTFFGFIYVIIP